MNAIKLQLIHTINLLSDNITTSERNIYELLIELVGNLSCVTQKLSKKKKFHYHDL